MKRHNIRKDWYRQKIVQVKKKKIETFNLEGLTYQQRIRFFLMICKFKAGESISLKELRERLFREKKTIQMEYPDKLLGRLLLFELKSLEKKNLVERARDKITFLTDSDSENWRVKD